MLFEGNLSTKPRLEYVVFSQLFFYGKPIIMDRQWITWRQTSDHLATNSLSVAKNTFKIVHTKSGLRDLLDVTIKGTSMTEKMQRVALLNWGFY